MGLILGSGVDSDSGAPLLLPKLPPKHHPPPAHPDQIRVGEGLFRNHVSQFEGFSPPTCQAKKSNLVSQHFQFLVVFARSDFPRGFMSKVLIWSYQERII